MIRPASISSRIRTFVLLACCILLSSATLIGCGSSGGGGGDDFSGAARVSLRVLPGDVDTGDRVFIEIEIRDVHRDGIQLKILYPAQLSYVSNTSFLEVAGVDLDIGPDAEVEEGGGRGDKFLIYTLDALMFEVDESGLLTLELLAEDVVRDGEIAVDADIDNGAFELSSPQFTAQESARITVRGESS